MGRLKGIHPNYSTFKRYNGDEKALESHAAVLLGMQQRGAVMKIAYLGPLDRTTYRMWVLRIGLHDCRFFNTKGEALHMKMLRNL